MAACRSNFRELLARFVLNGVDAASLSGPSDQQLRA